MGFFLSGSEWWHLNGLRDWRPQSGHPFFVFIPQVNSAASIGRFVVSLLWELEYLEVTPPLQADGFLFIF